MTEQPLVSIGEIAKYLGGVSKKTARKTLKEHKVPIFRIGIFIAVYPSTLKLFLEGNESTSRDAN